MPAAALFWRWRFPAIWIVVSVTLAAAATPPCPADVPRELGSRQNELAESLTRVAPAVVGVSDGFGVGSGVVVSADGDVLTASHVIDGARAHRIQPRREITITFPDGTEYPARVVGKNRDCDAALLRITRTAPGKQPFPHAKMGESGKLQPGQWCFALGNPGGIRQERPAPVRIGRVLSVGHRTIVSDCSIVLGDSGGPLFDMQGRVIGIHSMITSLIIENRHTAIDCWHRDWDRFNEGDEWGELRAYDNRLVETSFFGVGLKWKDFTADIRRVLPDSPADRAGLRPGDTLLSIDGEKFADRLDLGTLLSQIPDGKSIKVSVRRDDRVVHLSLLTGQQEDAAGELEDDRAGRVVLLDDQERDEEIQDQLSPGRRIGPFEKRAPDAIQAFDPVVEHCRNSIFRISDGGLLVCWGTVMSEDGYLLTKASEMDGVIDPECVFPNGRRYAIRQVATDRSFDIMLLKVDAQNLEPVEWDASGNIVVGDLAVVQDARGNPLIPTVVSVGPRELQGTGKPFLGVKMENDPRGVRIAETVLGGSARRFGIRRDDVVLEIDGIRIQSPAQMSDKVNSYQPGDKIRILILRDDRERTFEVMLTPRFDNTDAMLELYLDPGLAGQFASSVAGGFPVVLQHDADLFPKQMGGPLLNLAGKAIGLNIARADRVVSYAIPAETVLTIFRKLRAQDSMASR